MEQKFLLKNKVLVLIFCTWSAILFSQSQQKTAHPEPVTDFDVSNFCFGDTTYFTNRTIRADDFYWTIFELKITSDTVSKIIYSSLDSNIKFKFPLKGVYKVVLIGDNGHVVSKSRFVIVDSNPQAAFEYDQCTGKFTNASACYKTSRWDFGDGKASTQNDPVHYYSQTQKYKVKLTVYNAINDSVHLEKMVDITALNNTTINPGFSATVTKDNVIFKTADISSGDYTLFQWAFGDQEVSSLKGNLGRLVTHSFAKKDTSYLIFLVVKSGCATAFSSQVIFVPDSTPVEKTRLYPNPTTDSFLKIETERKKELTKISLTNSFGQLVDGFGVQETIKGYTLFFPNLISGIYTVTLQYGDEYKKYKFVKE